MKTTKTAAALIGLIASTHAQYISLTAVRSDSPIHLQTIEAAGQRLSVGGDAATYCPSDMQTRGFCPNTTDDTNFLGGYGGLALGAEVPGGQSVYIDPVCGAVMYTQAHSGFIPNGSIIGGWARQEGKSFGLLTWEGEGTLAGHIGLLACMTERDTYEVYADIGVTPPGDCIGFDVITANQTEAAAWQYM
ncbi:hypothetical protein LTR36_008585 [Oleoguttula mirabilis]|uniref:Uncharacterized protein n=1 Tax=Oleoguttula mirabilis TaxID=1507867 RepID=A0AAV9JV02_9PEZI|nr:hypothetical protein LTR36_008585 [Oleoguttula mirabilis]